MRRFNLVSFIVIFFSVCAFSTGGVTAQQIGQVGRYALVIGNADYADLGKLKNPHNDATDIALALKSIGFEVTLLMDADLIKMDEAVLRLSSNLSTRADSVGFFYYAGHGVQSGGVNYLIPSDANIPGESYLKVRALAAQTVMDNLLQARNNLNVIVLDACRDSPFSWARSGTRGLTVIGDQPAGSIVAYATSAGSVAQDGPGRNGVFTAELLKHIGTPGVEIKEVFNRTGAGVLAATLNRQNPAVYNQFFGQAFLAGKLVQPQVPPPKAFLNLLGSLVVRTKTAGILYVDGKASGDLRAGGAIRLSGIEVGLYELEIRYNSGDSEKLPVQIEEGMEKEVGFSWTPPLVSTTTTVNLFRQEFVDMVYIEGGSFMMGSNSGNSDERPAHKVNLFSFMLGKHEVTQEQYQKVMGVNPSYFKNSPEAPNMPVEQVSWHDAVAFCNVLSVKEGLSQVYTINGTTVTADLA